MDNELLISPGATVVGTTLEVDDADFEAILQ